MAVVVAQGDEVRILVTGGAGFIGSHLVEKLLTEGHEVEAYDRRPLEEWPDLPFTGRGLGDLRDLLKWGKIPNCRFDFCYHLASTVGVPNVLADPSECIDNIVNSTRAVLSLGIPGIYFSTSEVYGKNATVGGLDESSHCVLSSKSRWSYAAAKMCGEWVALQAGWKVVRPFNVIGPRQNTGYGAVVPRFVGQAIRGDRITVFGDGSQTRTFIDVRDFVDVLLKLAEKPFDVLNLGGTHIFTIKDLAHFVKFWFKSESEIVYVPYDKSYSAGFEECQSRIPSWKKLESLIGKQTYRRFGETLDSIAKDLQERNHVGCETKTTSV